MKANLNCASFNAFKRAAEAPDAQQIWFDEGLFKLGALAPALRLAMRAATQASKCGSDDIEFNSFMSLKSMCELDHDILDLVVDAS
jgi:hypothetical protein